LIRKNMGLVMGQNNAQTATIRHTPLCAIAGALLASLFLAATARAGGSIFDDDYVPPSKRPEPARPAAPPSPTESDKGLVAIPTPSAAPLVPPAAPPPVGGRRAIPDRARRVQCRKLFEEVFAADLKERTLTARKKLAQRLLDEGIKAPEGSADRFVLLTGAMEAAEDAMSIRLSFAAAEGLARSYDDVDEVSVKLEAAGQVFSGPVSPLMGSVYNVDALFSLADQLASENDFAGVDRIETALRHGVLGISDGELRTAVKDQIHAMESLRSAWQQTMPSLETLKRSPDDPAANAAVGSYLCFAQGQWEQGLPLLARAADPVLKALAMMELRHPTEPEEIATLGGGWYDEAAKRPVTDGPRILEHAASLYRSVLPQLTGLKKLAIEKRIEGIPSAVRHRRVDLLEMFDPAKSPVEGDWRMTDGVLACERRAYARVGFPYTPPAEYDLRVSFVVTSGSGAVVPICSTQDHQFCWQFGGLNNTLAGFEMIAGVGLAHNDSGKRSKAWLKPNERFACVIKVRKTGLGAYVNDQLVSS
jgi:hypothetical protein